ncbi:RNA polymerase sigma factor [uncultured Acetatifactor sp.]|uniref:RNA polymerase sigma factor n=1 Tax=uncultured Acetatifactor sp. TaxID=1671927 RepID=UPI00260413A7|nr:sigma factor [uncultured Acetatifactor sp.]
MIEDEKIIEMFFGRSEQGIRELDIKYGKVCHKLSYNIVNSRQDAEECVNDAYLGAWNAIPPAKPDPLLTYICKIVRNISVCAAAICLFPKNNDSVTTPGIADAAPMIYVNDSLYKQSASQTSFNELKDGFVYLGVIESDVTNFQGTNDAGNDLDGIPKENFQANHPIVGAEVYQYGDNIVVKIEEKYWLYENYHNTDLDGNPDGYDPLPNNQASGEEVSEQDPAAN